MGLPLSEDAKLTEAGWPRPIVDGLPIPWVSPPHDLSQMNPSRFSACASGAVCAVCGLGFQNDETAYSLVKEKEQPPEVSGVQAMDNAVMHDRCVRLSLKVCPKLNELRAAGELYLVKVLGNNARVVVGKDDTLRATFDPEAVVVLDLNKF